MKRAYRSVQLLPVFAVLVAAVNVRAVAETPGEIPKPWTYEGSMKLQQQQRQDQPAPQQQSPQAGNRGPSSGGAPGAAEADAARRKWLARPPLPSEQNPLLGKWTRPASTRPDPNNPFAQLQAMAKGGLCEVLFGGGVFEFRTDTLVGMDERTRPQELDRVEYRGDSKHVVVLPKTTVKLIEFDFDGDEFKLDQDVEPDKTGRLTFTVPDKTGTFEFFCPVDDHRQMGMTGEIKVEE